MEGCLVGTSWEALCALIRQRGRLYVSPWLVQGPFVDHISSCFEHLTFLFTTGEGEVQEAHEMKVKLDHETDAQLHGPGQERSGRLGSRRDVIIVMRHCRT